jgi:hypothetical protein
MMRLLPFFSLLLWIQPLLAQNTSELERRHGFKSLKLDMPIDSVKGSKLKKEFKERDEFLAKLYTIENPEYASIGEVTVDKVEVKTYNDIVYQIHVVTEKDPRLMKALESIYGLAEYDHKRETYFWKAQTMVLKFKSKSKNQLEMIYTSFSVNNLMKEDKNKKVQNIADDF